MNIEHDKVYGLKPVIIFSRVYIWVKSMKKDEKG